MMRNLMSRDEVRAIDRRAIEDFGLAGVVLMENAGRGCADLLISLGIQGTVVVCAGKGNNGGDGFVMARHLENHGHAVRVLLFCDSDRLQGDARINYKVIQVAGTPITVAKQNLTTDEIAQQLTDADWIVDALLGTGTRGSIREPFATAIQAINRVNANVLAVDLPSGMDCDTGRPLPAADLSDSQPTTYSTANAGCCVVADHTATFVARKLGFESEESKEFVGVVHVIDIGVPRTMLE